MTESRASSLSLPLTPTPIISQSSATALCFGAFGSRVGVGMLSDKATSMPSNLTWSRLIKYYSQRGFLASDIYWREQHNAADCWGSGIKDHWIADGCDKVLTLEFRRTLCSPLERLCCFVVTLI